MDLNTLISTIITSTAALVAIIGGFLVSRVITLSSEKNAISRGLQEISNDLSAKNKILKEMELNLFQEDVDDFIYYHCEDIIIKGKKIEDILKEDNSNNFSIDEIAPYIDKLFIIKETILNLMERASSLPKDFNKFLINNKYNIEGNKDWHELVYRTIYREIPDDSSNTILRINPPILPDLDRIHRENILSQQLYQDKVKDINKLKDEIHILNLREKEQIKILENYGRPNGIWGGLLVLFYAFIVGIAYPSMLLPYPKNTYNDFLTKWFLLFLFFSHLIVLFIYLTVSMYKLTKDDYNN